MVKLAVALVSTPPSVVPPSSLRTTVTVAVPLRVRGRGKGQRAVGGNRGCAEKARHVVAVAVKVKV